MPFLKFSRDRRGYEHFSIVEPSAGRRGKSSRPRVLFWFRTPPQVKVGREPFSDEIRRAIEAQNPGLKFDWVRLMATPIPAPDAEHWRERRRAEKAARQAMRESGAADQEHEEEQAGQAEQDGQAGLAGQAGQVGQVGEESDAEDDGDENAIDDTEHIPAETTIAPSDPQQLAQVSGGEQPGSGRRRRRRGRRKRPQTAASPAGPAATVSEPIAPNVPVRPAEEV